MDSATLLSRGRVTIPKRVRDRLEVRAGDRLRFRFDGSGHLILDAERQDPLAGVAGLLRHLAKETPVTVEEMSASVREHFRRKHERSTA